MSRSQSGKNIHFGEITKTKNAQKDIYETQEKNDELRAYGEQLGIITISDRRDIGNIGLVLLSILKK